MAKKQPGRVKRVPQRSCAVCGIKADKRALTRLVISAELGLQVDRTGKQTGRGTYICEKFECWQKAARSDVLAKALRASLNDEDRARILAAAPQPEP